jgi:predicted transcriptional regulator YdeE
LLVRSGKKTGENSSLLFLFKKRAVQKFEPQIVELTKTIKIAGLSIETNAKNVYRQVPEIGKRFNQLKKEKDIPNRKDPWGFAAVTINYDKKKESWTYIMGDVVTFFENVPKEFITYEIPAMTYARVPVRPKNVYVWGVTINQIKNYFYQKWLPDSGYQAAKIINDFEYHDERSFREKNPEIDLYFGIKK